jgi:hypothetical protein
MKSEPSGGGVPAPVSRLFLQTRHPAQVDEAYHALNVANCLNVLYWQFFFDITKNLDFQAIVECGVGRGRSLITIAALETFRATTEGRARRKIFALDSFEGFPEPSVCDQSGRNPQKGEWSTSPSGKYKYTPEFLRRILENAEIDLGDENIELVQGFFDDTIPTLDLGTIGILHLDGDLYRSILGPLEMLADKIVVGGLVIIDDFLVDGDKAAEKFPGARRAVEAFLAADSRFELQVSMRGTPYLVRTK